MLIASRPPIAQGPAFPPASPVAPAVIWSAFGVAPDRHILVRLPLDTWRALGVLPIRMDDTTIHLAAAHGLSPDDLRTIERHLYASVALSLCGDTALQIAFASLETDPHARWEAYGTILALGPESRDRTTRTIPIPADRIQPLTNQVHIAFSLLLPDDVCADELNPARYATVYEETAVAYGSATPAGTSPFNLGLFPAAFIPAASAAPINVTVALPSQPTPAELSAAATAVGQITRRAPGSRFIFDASEAKAPNIPPDRPIVAVGTPARNPLVTPVAEQLGFRIGDGSITAPDGQVADAGTGVLLLGSAPGGTHRAILALTGQNDAAVAAAGRLIGNDQWLQALSGPWSEAQQIDPADPTVTSPTVRFSIFPNGMTLEGARQAAASAKIIAPPLAAASHITLALSVARSANLDLEPSYLRLSVNDQAAGVVQLNEVTPDGTDVRMAIPARFLKAGVNTFTLTDLIRAKKGTCDGSTFGQAANIFLRVAPNVTVELPPAAPTSQISLAPWPYPVIGQTGVPPTLVAGSDGITALLQTAAILGPLFPGKSVGFNALTAGPSDPLPEAGTRIVFGSIDQLPYHDAMLPDMPLEIRGTTWVVRDQQLPTTTITTATAPGVIELVSARGGQTIVVTGTDAGLLPVAVRALTTTLPNATALLVYPDPQAGQAGVDPRAESLAPAAGLRLQPLTGPGREIATTPGVASHTRLSAPQLSALGMAVLATALCGLLIIVGRRRNR